MSKTLVLVRHGEAEPAQPGTDYERALTVRGRATARAVGALLSRLGHSATVVLCSSADRARQTSEELCAGAELELDPTLLRELYLGDPEAYARCISELDDHVSTALVVGHNPTISMLARSLCGESIALSPGEWVALELPVASWGEFGSSVSARRLEAF